MAAKALRSQTVVGTGLRLVELALPVGVGATASLALPPHYWLGLLLPAFSGLLFMLERRRSAGGAFATGWLFGLGYFSVGLSWLGEAFDVDSDRYGGLAIPAVMGLSMGLAIFTGFAGALFHAVRADRGLMRVAALAAAWTLAEWLRGTVLSGFPWNLIGYVWTATDETIQAASVTGVYGLGFITVVAAALPRLAFRRGLGARLSVAAPVVGSMAIIALLYSGGALRLQQTDPAPVPGAVLRIVQANIPQALKWQPGERERIFEQYLALSASGSAGDVTHLIWPETALPFLIGEDAALRALIAERLPGAPILLTGSVRRDAGDNGVERYYNSLLAIDPKGRLLGVYDKVKLVPFGEYMPLRGLLGLTKLTQGSSDFTAGRDGTVMSIRGVPPFSPIICYEAIFPKDVVTSPSSYDWLLNVTNDAWFGVSDGPHQHFQMARVRAVEQGVPLIRAANTGISAIVDPFGRVKEQLQLGVAGVIDAALPGRIRGATIYALTGPAPVLALSAAILLSSGKSASIIRRAGGGLRSRMLLRSNQLKVTKR